jgi:hypothetical protein
MALAGGDTGGLVYTGYQAAQASRGKFDEGGGGYEDRAFHMRPDEQDYAPRFHGKGTW